MSSSLSLPQDSNAVEEFPPSGFGKAMVELIGVQGRLAEEHAREVSKLQRVNATLVSQLSDLRSRMDEVTNQYEETAHLALVPSERLDSTNAQFFQDECDTSSESTSPPELGNYKSALGAAPSLAPREVPPDDLTETLVGSFVPRDAPPDDFTETLTGSLDADYSLDNVESAATESYDCETSVRRPSTASARRPSTASVRRLGSKSLAAAMSAEACDSETSIKRLASTSSVNRLASTPTVGPYSSTSTDKSERRANRLRTVLTARLRTVWVLDVSSDFIVPRWSQTSMETLSSTIDENPTQGLGSQGVSRTRSRFNSPLGFKKSSSVESMKAGFPGFSCIVHPQSLSKIMMDLMGMLIMGYDFFMTPLMFFNLPDSDFLRVMGWATRIFWTFDMWLNFHTAIYQKGKLVRKFRPIAKNYVKTMFFPDLAIVIAEWIAYILESTSQGGRSLENVYLLRALKGLRFAKVLRIFKFERIMQDFTAQINSTLVLLWLRPLILVFFLLVFNHTLACLWYGIGISSKGWTEIGVQDKSFGYMYMTALHWAVSQLHGNMEVFPQNVLERVFMCSNAIVALILYSTFLSSITNGMMEIRALQAELHDRKTKLRACLARRHISTELTMRIKKRLDYLSSAKTGLEAEASILSFLPKDLLIDLYEESRGPTVLQHMFFSLVSLRGPRIIRQLCHDSMSEASHMPDQIVFSTGDACASMYFVTSGDLLYELRARSNPTAFRDETCFLRENSFGPRASSKSSSKSETLTNLSSDDSSLPVEREGARQPVICGTWLCEAALWMTWEYCGRLTSRTPSLLLMVNGISFATVMTKFHFAHVNSKRYAMQFIDRMVREGLLTDIVPDDDILSHDDI